MKKTMLKKMTALMLSVLMLLALFACGSKPADTAVSQTPASSDNAAQTSTGTDNSAATEERHIEFTFGANSANNNATVFTFDPAVDYNTAKATAMGMAETLLALDANKEVQPKLATAIENTDDTTWVLTIRDGVTFSNGKELTAEMVKKSLEYTLSVNERLSALADVASMEADGQTLTVHTNAIVAIFDRVLTEPNMAIFDVEGTENLDKNMIGTGAYILTDMDSEGNCTLVRNDNYWQGTPIAETIHTKANLDSAAITLALQSGEIDWSTGVSTSDLALFAGNPDYEVQEYNAARAFYLYVNPNYTFTMDPALREALQYAIDRDAIIAGVYSGYGFSTQSIFPDYSEYYDASLQQAAYDKDKAAQILADAGYADADGDGFLEKDGQKVTLNILCYAKNQFDTLSEVLQSILKGYGIDATIQVSDSMSDDANAGEFNLATYGYNTLTLGDCYNYLYPVFHSQGTANFNDLNDAEIDGWLDELKVTSDMSKRVELVKKIQEKVYASNEYIYIMHVKNTMVSKAGIVNLPPMLGSDQMDNCVLWTVDRK